MGIRRAVAWILLFAALGAAGSGLFSCGGSRPPRYLTGRVTRVVDGDTVHVRVGGRDEAVLELNREAALHLRCEHRIEIVPGATHLFEEPGALVKVSELAARWFVEHMARARP